MRKLALIPILALMACSGENSGWNPNYRAEATPYGNYLRAREVALTGQIQPPRVIPVALPVQAPTAAEIAGPRRTRVVERVNGKVVAVQTTRPVPLRGAPAIDPRLPGVLPTVLFPAGNRRVSPVTIAPAARAETVPLLTRYAASSRHAVGTRVWPRSPAVSAASCDGYANADAAQTAFLLRGGPARDPLGLDPDDDGYVCGWNPDAWRNPPL